MLDEREAIQKKARIAEEATQRARERARIAKWDINIVIFMFAILLVVVILLFEGFTTTAVGPIAFLGLVMGWFVGWRRERQLYEQFYKEEMSKYQQDQEELSKYQQD